MPKASTFDPVAHRAARLATKSDVALRAQDAESDQLVLADMTNVLGAVRAGIMALEDAGKSLIQEVTSDGVASGLHLLQLRLAAGNVANVIDSLTKDADAAIKAAATPAATKD